MSFSFDATLKEIVSQAPADFLSAFHLPATQPVTALNVDLSTISAATDVALGFGRPLQEIVDLNFQSGPDSAVAARLHVYNALLHLRFGVAVRSVLVLLRPKADSRELTGRLSYPAGDPSVRFEYEVIRLWQQPVETFLHGGVGLLPLATLCKMPSGMSLPTALRHVISEIDMRLSALPDHAQAVRLMSAAHILTTSRIARDSAARIFAGATLMHTKTYWDEVEDALIKNTKRNILSFGRQKFGEPDPRDEKALNRIKEFARLERMVDRIGEMNSWKELLAVR